MEFLKPLSSSFFDEISTQCSPTSLFHYTDFFHNADKSLQHYQLAILGICDERLNESTKGISKSADEIRKEFYRLIKPRYDIKIIDLGNVEAGNTITDTYFAVRQTLSELLKQKIVCLLIGASEDFIYQQYAAYEQTHFNMNVVLADARVALKTVDDNPLSSGYLSNIIAHPKNYLFNVAHVGHQSYFVEPESYDAFERMNFDMMRLGLFKGKIQNIEPLCRNADMMAFNMNTIKGADAPGQVLPSANGFSGEDACQIARYAGISNDISSFGIYNINPAKDISNLTSQLAAQMLWYFIDGFYARKNEYPTADSNDYMIYYTSIQGTYEINFYKNKYTDRWWMEVPYPKDRSNQKGSFMVPCSYSDYEIAMTDEIPDRWIKAYQKLI